MTERPSHLIRAGHGRIKVLRLATIGRVLLLSRYQVEVSADGWCRFCGCTALFGCTPQCYWVDLAHTVCSRCFTKEMLP